MSHAAPDQDHCPPRASGAREPEPEDITRMIETSRWLISGAIPSERNFDPGPGAGVALQAFARSDPQQTWGAETGPRLGSVDDFPWSGDHNTRRFHPSNAADAIWTSLRGSFVRDAAEVRARSFGIELGALHEDSLLAALHAISIQLRYHVLRIESGDAIDATALEPDADTWGAAREASSASSRQLALATHAPAPVTLNLPGDLWLPDADTVRAAVVISVEAAHNALIHTYRRNGLIEISVVRTASRVVIRITDDGPGIDIAGMKPSSRTLGMHIMRLVSAQFNARLTVERRLTGGTEVRMVLLL